MSLRPELLAPAGSFDALRAAVWAGADAVYLGGKSFSARAGASNFDEQGLIQAVRFAHQSGVKVYVTVNTLIKEDELPQALDFLRFVYNSGADAAILQDIGLVRLAASHIPQLEIHASTQLTTASLAGVKALKDIGVSRVVLARELTAKQIVEITAESILPIEVFLHGALCVGYSGQCLLSSLVGGRSGNRGQCAQPCRLPYAAGGRAPEYMLSPKDLCLIDHLPEILGLGIASLKIEGRLKRPEYVAEVVSIYREAIDLCLSGKSYTPRELERTRLAQAFNRGFTAGYIGGKPGGALYSGERPDNRGVPIGTIASTKGSSVLIHLDSDVSTGDVLDIHGTTALSSANAKAGETITLDFREDIRATKGVRVNRVVDARRNQDLMAQIDAYEPPKQTVDWTVVGKVGSPLQVSATSGAATVQVVGEAPLETARGSMDIQGLFERQLSKLGGTAFSMGTISVDVPTGTHVALSEVNNFRRQVVDALGNLLWVQSPSLSAKTLHLPKVERPSLKPQLGVSVSDLAEAKAAVDGGANYLVFGQEWLPTSEEAYMATYREVWDAFPHLSVALRLPRILHTREESKWSQILPEGVEIYASSPAAVKLAQDLGCKIRGDVGLNIMNSVSCTALPTLLSVTLSHELASPEARELASHTSQDLEMIVHGHQLLMIKENCLWSGRCEGRGSCKRTSTIRDRKGIEFPVHTDFYCRSYILNSHVLSLLDSLGQISRMGVSRMRLDIAGAGARVVEHTTRAYSSALLEGIDRERVAVLRGNLSSYWGLLTRGHWQRGV